MSPTSHDRCIKGCYVLYHQVSWMPAAACVTEMEKPFLTLDKMSQQLLSLAEEEAADEYTKGLHYVPEEHAGHWFTQAHAELTDQVNADDGEDLQKLKDALAQREQLKANQDTIDALNLQIEDLAQLAASLIGGEGGKKCRKTNLANRK